MTFTEFVISIIILSAFSLSNFPKHNHDESYTSPKIIEINNKISFCQHSYYKHNNNQFYHDPNCHNPICVK